jgi:lipoprotein-anchoring transpeptidase ErfK/SrfK
VHSPWNERAVPFPETKRRDEVMTKPLRRGKAALVILLVIAALLLPQAAHAKGNVHKVKRGETLYSIARRYGTTVNAIVKANGIKHRNRIYVGQRLSIPGKGSSKGGKSSSGGVHVVRRGENLSMIARRYGTSISAIVKANGIRNANRIYVGQKLRIPGKSGGSSNSSGGGSSKSSGGGSSKSTGRGKWIEVDLSSQRVYARQGNSVVRKMVVSTGTSRYPTPVGRFRIYAKYRSVTMSGPGYHLPGVPHTMFFYRGYALHGTYWHNNFGRRMSHGCINLKRGDAKWLYNWAPKRTLVVIHR